MMTSCNRKQPVYVGDVLFFCESFPHYVLDDAGIEFVTASLMDGKAFPHDSAVHLLKSPVMLPDSQSYEGPAS